MAVRLPEAGFSFLASDPVDIQECFRSVRNDDEDWIFRGQGVNRVPQPRFFRSALDKPKKELEQYEKECIEKWRAELGIGCNESRISDWGLLTCVQHYGGPTRFLDWTKSLSVAIYFAATSRLREIAFGAPRNSSKNAVVWALKTTSHEWISWQCGMPSLSDIREVSYFRPDDIDLRVVAQNSIFSVHPIPKSTFDLARGAWPNFVELRNTGQMICIAFDDESLPNVFEWLKESKVCEQSIFPDPLRIANLWSNSYEALTHLRTVRNSVGMPWRAPVK